jgi:DNA polymerase III epsilon subunit-like protein
MKILFIDTETTGLPTTAGWDKYYPPSELEYYENARLIEFACILYDTETKEIVHEYSTLVKPVQFTIRNSHIHGITTEEAFEKGIYVEDVLISIWMLLKENNVSKIVAHKILFDMNILRSECHRCCYHDVVEILEAVDLGCTMKMGQERIKSWKSPKLTELYSFLFQEEFEQDHRALSDVRHCFACYVKMIEDSI